MGNTCPCQVPCTAGLSSSNDTRVSPLFQLRPPPRQVAAHPLPGAFLRDQRVASCNYCLSSILLAPKTYMDDSSWAARVGSVALVFVALLAASAAHHFGSVPLVELSLPLVDSVSFGRHRSLLRQHAHPCDSRRHAAIVHACPSAGLFPRNRPTLS